MINEAEFKHLIEHPLIAIGSHSCNHFRLNSSLEPEIVEREICDSRVQLENSTKQDVPLFCYPNGDYTRFAKEKVAATYQAAVTTQRGINTASSPLHELKRVAVNEGGSDTQNKFEALLSGWFD
jgi:peptidoglycan/xylan/chitin deacetylase (PgdA/CDA1 family)